MNRYLILFLILFGIETTIALLHFNPFVRGFLGDVLVIPLIYCLLKISIKNHSKALAFGVLFFACALELLQLFKLHETFKIQSKILLTLLGSVFDPLDFAAYTTGFLLVLLIEKLFQKNENIKNISL